VKVGQTRTKKVKHKFPVGPGPAGKYLILVVDEGGQVSEIEEGNNQAVNGPVAADPGP
jgi:hypothetical protein